MEPALAVSLRSEGGEVSAAIRRIGVDKISEMLFFLNLHFYKGFFDAGSDDGGRVDRAGTLLR